MKRGLRAALFAPILLATACHGRPRSAALDSPKKDDAKNETGADKDKDAVYEFDLSNGIPESQSGGFLLPIPASRTYAGLVRELDHARRSKNARSFFVRLGDTALGWAHSEELGLAFENLRKGSGKAVVCHAHSLDNRAAWFVARACSRVWLSPAGDTDTVGIAAQVVYLKGALDKLKVHADFLHVGKYKSAAETLTQEGPSDAARESLTAVLASMRQTWLETYAASRPGPDRAATLEDGPFSAEEAKARGLVDAVGYESDARADAEARAKTDNTVTVFGKKGSEDGGPDIAEILRALAGSEATKRPHIAVVPAEGAIAMSQGSPLSESGITAKALSRVIHRLTRDDAVKAVVLRIDSPGGSALASDLLWHDLMELRKKKPLVASVGDMAASGGYYLACAANKVIAPRTSIVGSIGVVGGKIVLNEALSEYGVHAETFPASPAPNAGVRAAYLSPFVPWDDPTRERVQKQMQSVYDLFVSRVAEGRGLPADAVRAVAEGRIWSGVQGLNLHLVDEIGGLGKALDVARTLGKLDVDAPVRVEGLAESLLESLFGGAAEGADEAMVRRALASAAQRPRKMVEGLAEPAKRFVGALAPMLAGETVLAAMDFGVVVK